MILASALTRTEINAAFSRLRKDELVRTCGSLQYRDRNSAEHPLASEWPIERLVFAADIIYSVLNGHAWQSISIELLVNQKHWISWQARSFKYSCSSIGAVCDVRVLRSRHTVSFQTHSKPRTKTAIAICITSSYNNDKLFQFTFVCVKCMGEWVWCMLLLIWRRRSPSPVVRTLRLKTYESLAKAQNTCIHLNQIWLSKLIVDMGQYVNCLLHHAMVRR